ncbi:MAG: HAD-IIIA family hydrolase, partial [Clostridiales bacterium]|nr:HAD-IIIA family hydrolase [Clostridiales bacterium]
NKYVGFLKTVGQVELETGAAEAIKRINESEYLAVVITNQPVVARGECSLEELNQIHNRIYTLLGREGAYLDGLYFCPHHPDRGFEGEVAELKLNCDCRKPKTGMLKKAETEYNADLVNSWFVGDTTMDVQTGINAGMRTVILRGGNPQKGKDNVVSDLVADNLLDAVKMILSSEDV